jgi:hypothetical protein
MVENLWKSKKISDSSKIVVIRFNSQISFIVEFLDFCFWVFRVLFKKEKRMLYDFDLWFFWFFFCEHHGGYEDGNKDGGILT